MDAIWLYNHANIKPAIDPAVEGFVEIVNSLTYKDGVNVPAIGERPQFGLAYLNRVCSVAIDSLTYFGPTHAVIIRR